MLGEIDMKFCTDPRNMPSSLRFSVHICGSRMHTTDFHFICCTWHSQWFLCVSERILVEIFYKRLFCLGHVYWAPMMGTRQFDTTNPRISFHFRKGFFLSIRSFYETFKKLLSRKQVSWHWLFSFRWYWPRYLAELSSCLHLQPCFC